MVGLRLHVRTATEDDTPFLVNIAREAYRDVVTRQFGSWNEREQATRFAAKVTRLPFEVGGARGRPIAAVSSSVHADHVFLNELLVLPECQNRASAASCSNVRSGARGNSASRCGCTR